MVRSAKPTFPLLLLAPTSFIAAFPYAASSKSVRLSAMRVVRQTKELAEEVESGRKVCFRANPEKKRLAFYRKSCDKIKGSTKAAQVWELSDPLPSALADDALLLEQKYGNFPDTRKKIEKIRSYAKSDTVGRLIFMRIGQKKVAVGFLKTDIRNDETEMRRRPYLAELCTGPWRALCTYKKSERKYVWRFLETTTGDDFEHDVVERKLVDVLYSGIYSRGNDDYQPHTYFEIKGPNPSARKFPLMEDWVDALKPLDVDHRLMGRRIRSTLPRTEANFMTALHTVNVVRAVNGEGVEQNFLHFGAEVFFAREISEASCEDDSGQYALYDLDDIKPALPIRADEIAKLDLWDLKRWILPTLYDYFFQDIDGYSKDHKSPVTLTALGGSAPLAPEGRNAYAFTVMKRDSPDSKPRVTNVVKKYFYLDVDAAGKWSSELLAFNPNDWRANNIIHEKRQAWYSPESIRKVWDSETSQSLGKTHPVLRAPMTLATKIPLDHSTPAERELSRVLRNQFKEWRFQGADLNTVHASFGLEDRYYQLMDSFTYDTEFAQAIDPNRLPSFVYLSDWVGGNEKVSIKKADLLTLYLFTDLEKRDPEPLLREAKRRIYYAKDPVAAIKAEAEYQSRLSDETSAFMSFYRSLETLEENKELINKFLLEIWKVPRELRLPTYKHTTWDSDGNAVVTVEPLPAELHAAVFSESALDILPTVNRVYELIAPVNDAQKSDEERAAAAKTLYDYLHTSAKELDVFRWIMVEYRDQFPRG